LSGVLLEPERDDNCRIAVTPGLKLELLNSTRVVAPPANPVMSEVLGRRGYAPGGRIRFYIEFPSVAGLTYPGAREGHRGRPVEDPAGRHPGTGNRLNWLDDGTPKADSPPTAARFYCIGVSVLFDFISALRFRGWFAYQRLSDQ
jgi:hypothetical protein